MKSKSFALLSLSILIVLVFTAFASAVTLSATTPATLPLTTGTHNFTIDVTGNATEDINFSLTSITENGKTITFTAPADITNATGSAQTITISYTIPSDFKFYFGKTYSTTLTANGTLSGIATQTVSFKSNTPIEYDDTGSLEISIDDISVESGFGPEDNEWYLMDKITADIEVEANEDMSNIVIEWGLYDKENGNWIVDGEENDFDLDDGDKETITITFQLDEDAMDEIDTNANDYVFYAWATGEDDDDNKSSVLDSMDVELQIEDDFVILENIAIPESASCGNEIQITADVWNIGSDDQNDVYVIIYNKELGINKRIVIGDIDSFESSDLDVTLALPEDMDKKSYYLEFSVYDEDSDIYENSNDDESVSSKILNVEGACSLVPEVSVAATLGSDAKSGKELIIKATIANSGLDKETLNLGLSGYSDWASLISIDKTTFDLNAGQTESILIKLKVNSDVSGDKQFDLIITEGDKILNQPIKVSIEKSTFQLPSSITGLFTGASGNLYLWGIGALNVLLILIIIVVAVRVAKKK